MSPKSGNSEEDQYSLFGLDEPILDGTEMMRLSILDAERDELVEHRASFFPQSDDVKINDIETAQQYARLAILDQNNRSTLLHKLQTMNLY